jgi:hypothetical protein
LANPVHIVQSGRILLSVQGCAHGVRAGLLGMASSGRLSACKVASCSAAQQVDGVHNQGCSQMFKPTSNGMKWLLRIAGVLVLLAGFQLYILTEHTDTYFAWTIQPFLTAAFLGGGYFSSCLIEFLASRKAVWAEARIAVPAVFTFTTLTLIATLVHIDRFHFSSSSMISQGAAWFWLAIYGMVPPLILLAWFQQYRLAGDSSPRTNKLPLTIRSILLVQGAVMLVWGIGLFAIPEFFAATWPWKLSILTSRAIGAWLIGIGVFAVHSVLENDYGRIKVGLISYLAFGILEIISLLRYPESIIWNSWTVWLYLALILSITLIGLYSTRRLTQLRSGQ